MPLRTNIIRRTLRNTILNILDIVLIVFSVFLAARLRYDGYEYVEGYIVMRVLYSVPLLVFTYITLTIALGAYKISWRYADIRDMLKVLVVCAGTAVLTLIINRVFDIRCPRLVISISSVIAFLFILVSRFIWILVQDFLFTDKSRKHVRRCVIIGANADGMRLSRNLSAYSEDVRRVAVAYLDDDIELLYRKVDGLPVEGTFADVGEVVKRKYIDEVVLSGAHISAAQLWGVYTRTVNADRRLLMRGDNDKLRELTIEDALSCMTDSSVPESVVNKLKDDCFLVCGASTVVGHELARIIAANNVNSLTLMDTDENVLSEIRAELGDNARYIIGDASDEDEFTAALNKSGANRVFYLCTLNRSELSQDNSAALCKRNIYGVKNAYFACAQANVKSFSCVSTVNAYSPRNAVDMSATLGEREFLNMSADLKTLAQVVRIDNVVTSPSGVLARMRGEMSEYGHVTCRKEMRGFLSAEVAASDVLSLCALGTSGEYIIDIDDSVNLEELARAVVRESKGNENNVKLLDGEASESIVASQRLAPTDIPHVFHAQGSSLSNIALDKRAEALKLALANRDESAMEAALTMNGDIKA